MNPQTPSQRKFRLYYFAMMAAFIIPILIAVAFQ